MASKYMYIGPDDLLTKCEIPDEKCEISKMCPGIVQGHCPFSINGKVMSGFEHLFINNESKSDLLKQLIDAKYELKKAMDLCEDGAAEVYASDVSYILSRCDSLICEIEQDCDLQ